jgi:hypothetical protein
MAVHANSVVKSYSSFSVSEGLLAKVVEAVKQGENLARRSGQVRSFEVFYHGHRANLVLGRIMVIPAAVADSIEDFPSALLYGAMVKELNGEMISDTYTFKLGEGEFDTYSKKDLAEIKDKLFKDIDGKYRSLVMFIPTWAAPRDYVTFKYVKDEERLSMLLRHLVFAAYFDPRFSSSFEKLTEETTSQNLDLVDITPKLNFPFLAEGLIKSYPELHPGDKRASAVQKPKIILAKGTLKEINEELLEPGEHAVMNQLGQDLEARLSGDDYIPKEAAVPKSEHDAHRDHAHAQGKGRTCTWKHMSQDGKCSNCGFDRAKKASTKVALGFHDEQSPLKSGESVVWKDKDHQINKTQGTVEGDHIRWDDGKTTRLSDAVAMSNVQRAEKTASTDDTGAETGLRNRPDYGESDSHTVEANELAAKDAGAKIAADLVRKHGNLASLPAIKLNATADFKLPARFASLKTVGEQLTALHTAATAEGIDPKRAAGLMRVGEKLAAYANNRQVRAALAGFCQCGKSGKTAAKSQCPCCGAPVSPMKELLAEYVEKHGGVIPGALYVNVDQDYVSTERPDHYNYTYVSQAEAERILGRSKSTSTPGSQEERERQRRTDEILNGQAPTKAASKSEPIAVLATAGAKLMVVGSALVAQAESGYKETLRVNASRLKWTQPNKFTQSFRQATERAARLPRVANLMKQADVPQSIEEIWSDKMEDMGPAPEVEVKEAPSAPAPKGESRVEKTHERRGEESEAKKPQEKRASSEHEAGLGRCANCTFKVTAKNGSEVAPEVFLHAACQRALTLASADKLVAHQVLASFYPEILRSRSVAIRASVEQAMKDLREKQQIPDNTEFHDLSPNEQHTVLNEGRKIYKNEEYAKAASFDLFIPGQVAQEFAPETLHEIVDFPEESYNPLITDVGPAPEPGPYVSTDPAGALGIGADGKPQVLDGAPLRKTDEIRGPMFDQEFYQQFQGISPDGLRAASIAGRVRKNADASEYKRQFSDFLKKVVGEVAATFIAAFKVTLRPMMSQVPGSGEIQLQNVEQPQNGSAFNVPNVSSRVTFLVEKLNDSDIQDAINGSWAQASVWNDDENGGYVYEVFVRPESLDQDTLVLRYSFVVGTKGL